MTVGLNPTNHNQFSAMLQRAWKQHQAGQLQAAEDAYLQLLVASPGDPDTNNLIGLLFIQTGRPAIAEVHIRKALEAEAGNPQTVYNLGIACKDQRKWNDAAEAFKQCVAIAPNHVDGINSLANCLRNAGQMEQAVEWFDRALALAPNHPVALFNKGMLLIQMEQYEEAESCLELAVSLNKSNAEAWNDLGVARNKLGKPEQALAAYREATRSRGDFASAWLNRGLLEEQLGRLEEAASSYRQAITADGQLADAHFHLAHLRSHQSTPAEIEAMENLLNQGGLEDGPASRLAYGMGFAHEAGGNHDRAFHFMHQAHRLLGRRHRFDIDRHREAVADNIAMCTREQLSAWSASGGDERPVFICGMPRSGTTLVEQILASHPDVHATGEQTVLAQLAGELAADTGTHYPACLGQAGEEWRAQAAGRYEAEVLAPAGDAARVTDTTPMNYLYLALAMVLYPQARVVLCMRDPMDNCLSIYRQPLTSPHAYAHDLQTLGHFYALHTQLARHWQETLGGGLAVVRYEALVSEPESQIRSLLAHCGLPFDSACLAFHETDRQIRSPSASQVRRPLFSSSIGAWRKYEHHLALLKEALGLLED